MKLIEVLKEALVGNKIYHKNQHGRFVSIVAEDVAIKSHSRQITPDTRENDWYGDSCNWQTIEIKFEDGSVVDFTLDSDISISNN